MTPAKATLKATHCIYCGKELCWSFDVDIEDIARSVNKGVSLSDEDWKRFCQRSICCENMLIYIKDVHRRMEEEHLIVWCRGGGIDPITWARNVKFEMAFIRENPHWRFRLLFYRIGCWVAFALLIGGVGWIIYAIFKALF